ncbi:hypothetical protein VFPPC_17543 [Pochonia chlamydosporia 170]|uniref:Uncharacterized protein n=1 Tax=Pochonia chlamydosporia 170 TaxID=1380566 RepID=A0A219ASM3_METCM|nr:hypothetical protein VFPPC_17543 [Pochonia chlamydosporia 170]OWT43294.1 hypothetical protein VFPPC_17543 [Pochonia chlamydosporia 170]
MPTTPCAATALEKSGIGKGTHGTRQPLSSWLMRLLQSSTQFCTAKQSNQALIKNGWGMDGDGRLMMGWFIGVLAQNYQMSVARSPPASPLASQCHFKMMSMIR